MGWTPEIYQSRIANHSARTRHPAGSPSAEEIGGYSEACDGADSGGTALVLGMTPELRIMAARRFRKVVAIDSSEVAINLFADWLPESLRKKEKVIHGLWTDLDHHLTGPVAVVLGDGIVGNLPGYGTTVSVLKSFRKWLAPGGRCVMRNVIVMRDVATGRFRFTRLLEDFRAGRIDAAEFGFTARILGFHDVAYDPDREVLDNARVYAELDAMERAGDFSAEEASAIARYRFMGTNYFPSEQSWRELLAAAGFSPPENQRNCGKLWNDYYPVQSFFPV
ncbi:MAG: class I SAM-dependent methyltransferase [Verrucomicrobiota bacterium]